MAIVTNISISSRSQPLNRREFLAYVFLMALLLFGLLTLAFFAWSVWPRPTYIRVGDATDFPHKMIGPGIYPVSFENVRLYLVNTGSEFIAFDRHTPYDRQGCIFMWVSMTGRFEDPCTGAKFAPDGAWLAGPTSRNLDRFPVKVEDGQIWVNTSKMIKRAVQAEYMFCMTPYNQPGVSCWSTY